MLSDERIKGYETQVCAPTVEGSFEAELQDAVNSLLGERREFIEQLRWRSMKDEPPKLEDLPIEAYNPDTKDTFPLWLVNEANFVSLGKKHFWRPLGALPKKEGV